METLYGPEGFFMSNKSHSDGVENVDFSTLDRVCDVGRRRLSIPGSKLRFFLALTGFLKAHKMFIFQRSNLDNFVILIFGAKI